MPGAAPRAAAHSSRSHAGLGQAVVVGEREQLSGRRARAVVAGGAGPAALAPQQPDRQPAGPGQLEVGAAAVVDDDHLELVARMLERGDGG